MNAGVACAGRALLIAIGRPALGKFRMNRRVFAKLLAGMAAMMAISAPLPATAGDPVQIVPTVPGKPTAQRGTGPAYAPNPCAAQYDVIGPDGKMVRTEGSSIGASGTGILSIRMGFKGRLPDPEIISASNHEPTVQIGGLSISARQASRSDLRLEKAGDPRPIYMREAPVLRIGKTWFAGDNIDFLTSVIDIGVDADFMDLFQNARTFELWWKGARRMTFTIVPETMSPEKFSAECLPLPANIRAQLANNQSTGILRRVVPSPTPRLMSFISFRNPGQSRSSPFSIYDETAGSALFRLTVGRDGLVKQCDLVSGTGKVPERPKACEVARRWARFYPATDKSGMLVEAEAPLRLDWGPDEGK